MNDKNIKYFHCKSCRFVWKTEDYLTKGDDIVAVCPICEKSDHVIETTYRVANLALAWDNATGPITPEGKARVSLNGWKNGRNASQYHLLAPAKPGKYSICNDCQYFEECKKDYKYCPVDLETLARFVQAYKEQNVNDLREIAGLFQGKMAKILTEMFHHVIVKGAMLEVKEPCINKDGELLRDDEGKAIIKTNYIKNALIKDLPIFMQSLGFDAVNQDMTPKTRQETEALKGYLDDKETDQEKLIEIKKRTHDELVKMREAVQNLTAVKKFKEFEKQRDEQSTTPNRDASGDGDQEISE